MHIKIYFNDKPLFLCDAIDPVIEPFMHHDDAVFIDELNVHTIKSMIHEMQLEKVHAGIFLHADLQELKEAFFRKFDVIQAGGGLIHNEKEETLLIFRRGKWDLPKGKLDDGETIEQCAVREVWEETGLQANLEAPLLITYHTYHQGTHFIIKESHWYSMKVTGENTLRPQTEEDIEEAKWVDDSSLSYYLPLAYPSIVDVLEAWLAK
ncbi:MAG: NUDIX domain-containing protein [Chitinophagaceae bacterium]